MSSKHIMMMILMLKFKHTSLMCGASVKDLEYYADSYRLRLGSSDYSLSESTIRRALPYLLETGYIADGVRYGKVKTYYLTEKAQRELQKSDTLKIERNNALQSLKG